MPPQSAISTPFSERHPRRTPVHRGTQLTEDVGSSSLETVFTMEAMQTFRAQLIGTAFAFERSARDEDEGIEAPARGLGGDELTRTREARLALLARKYEGQASTEDVARIHLLTERLRRLDPRVTEGERRAAQEVVESLERVTLAVTNIRNEFGL